MVGVEFHFDFGSPNAYLAHLVIPEIERRTGVAFEYVPILLGGVFKLTNNRSPAESLAGIKNKPEYENLEMRRSIARRIRAVRRRDVSAHVGRSEEDGRPARAPRGARGIRAGRRSILRASPDPRDQGRAPRQHGAFGRARDLRSTDFLRRGRDLSRQGSAA